MEIWIDIEGYEGLYQVSNLGNVRSLKYGKERILKPAKSIGGYLQVNLCKEGKVKAFYIHRLVGKHFIPNPQNLPQINHRDEDKTNNVISNLEFCDRKYNCNYGTRNKRVAEKTSKQVLCVETGVIYPSAHQLERELGFNQGYISKCCNGKFKQAYGYMWQYVN